MNVDLESIDTDDVGLIVVDAQQAFASETSSLADRGVGMTRATETVPRPRTLLSTAGNAAGPIAFTRSVRRADGKDAPRRVYDIPPGTVTIAVESEYPICRPNRWSQ